MAEGMIAATIISAGASAYGAYQSYQTGQQNAKIGRANARAAKQKAAYDESLHRERVRKLLSSQKALYGKSGVEASSGSPLLALEETVTQGELDALAIRMGGDVSAMQARMEGKMKKRQGTALAIQGMGRAGSTLLSGGSRYYATKNP